MKVKATQIKARELLPGDLFSTAGPSYWETIDPRSIGERVYIRTNAPCPPGQEEIKIYQIEIIREESDDKQTSPLA